MSRDSTTPDTIVLIHGFWVTPRSWEHWIPHYEARGYRVLAPGYPGFEVEVEALNADPSPIESLTVPQIIEHLETIIGELESPPILIGHSAGGVFVQILLDHGFGAVGVAINSAPTEGVAVVPLSQVRSTFPVLKNPANRHRAVGFTYEQWRYAFTNTFSEERSRELYERYAIPASGRIFWESAFATLTPGHQGSYVNYANDDRAPLLFISGREDHLMPPSVQRSNAKHYRSSTVTEIKEFEGPHLLPPGRAGRRSPTRPWSGPSATRSGGPPHRERPDHPRRRADRAHRGRRVAAADRPDVRPPGPQLPLRVGHGVAQGGRTGDRRRGPAADRRGAAQPRPLEAPGRPPIEITATPCRHGPPLSRPIVGDVIGFALAWDGQEHGALWVSGDTVLYDGVREVADRLRVDVALLHLGGVRFPVSGPVRYTMTGRDAVELCRLVRPRTAIPIHYEGWAHFRQGRDAVEREIAGAPADIARRFRWLPIGVPVELDASAPGASP